MIQLIFATLINKFNTILNGLFIGELTESTVIRGQIYSNFLKPFT